MYSACQLSNYDMTHTYRSTYESGAVEGVWLRRQYIKGILTGILFAEVHYI